VPRSLSGSWGSILPIISLCVKQNVKTNRASMSHISRQHSQRYGWHPACLPQHTPLPQTTHYSGPWLSLTPPSAGECGQCGTWSSNPNHVGEDMRSESRRKQNERGEKRNLFHDSDHVAYVCCYVGSGLVCKLSVIYYVLNGCWNMRTLAKSNKVVWSGFGWIESYTLKNAGLFQPKFGSNMDKPKCWAKNVI